MGLDPWPMLTCERVELEVYIEVLNHALKQRETEVTNIGRSVINAYAKARKN